MFIEILTYDEFLELSDYDKALYEKIVADRKRELIEQEIAEIDKIIEQQKLKIEELEKSLIIANSDKIHKSTIH